MADARLSLASRNCPQLMRLGVDSASSILGYGKLEVVRAELRGVENVGKDGLGHQALLKLRRQALVFVL